MRRFPVLIAALALLLLPAGTVAAQSAPPGATTAAPVTSPVAAVFDNGFDEWARALMDEWQVPGMAVAAIKDGEVVLSKGYGYRDIERQLPVTPRTLMAIGSNSKSFTVVLMGQLVDEGKLDWNEPVETYLPDFRLWDDYTTEHLRVKDLVTHVSGLPRHDALWYGRDFDRQQLYERLRHLEPTTSFRGKWQYQNLMFMTAGYLLEEITGRSWDDLIRERIFTPLEMRDGNTSVDAMPHAEDVALPYILSDGELHRVPYRDIDNVGPAGSINSHVEEMLHYIEARIGMGEWRGRRIVSEKNEKLMQSAQSVLEAPDAYQFSYLYPELGPATYGLALFVSSYRGHKWIQHGGGIDGFISQMAWLPDDGIGVMVLTNMRGDANPVPNIVVRRVFDDLLGYEPIDWNARIRGEVEHLQTLADERRATVEANRIAGTTPSHPLADYAGTYVHPAYGRINVVNGPNGLEASMDAFRARMKHYHYDVFELTDDGTARGELARGVLGGLATFHINKEGHVHSLAVPLESNVSDIVFVRESLRTDSNP